MADTARRLARLRELANTRTTPEYGRDRIAPLLDQEPGSADVSCPRFAGVCEHCGDRTILVDDDPGALADQLIELALSEVPHQPEAIVDLDTATRRDARPTLTLRFDPALPGAPHEPLVKTPPGMRFALRLLLDVAEENCEEHPELAEAIEVGDRLLQRIPSLAGSGTHR